MAVDGASTDASNAAQVFRSNAGHLQGHVQEAQRTRDAATGRSQHEDDGVLRFMTGPLIGVSEHQTPQTLAEVERFTSIRLGKQQLDAPLIYANETEKMFVDTYLPHKPGFALNAGGPVWGLDWCPQADDGVPACKLPSHIENAQLSDFRSPACEYLAISTVSEQPSLVYRIPQPLPACPSMIQIWSLDTAVPTDFGLSTSETKGRGMRFDLALLTDFEAIQLKWCPRGGASENASESSDGLERLGLLACLSAQGLLSIFDIPKPDSARQASSADPDDLVFSMYFISV